MNVTQAQGLYLELIRIGSFNAFDGERVVDDLLAHRDLWLSAMMVDEASEGGYPQFTLRDLPDEENNVSTLWVVAQAGKEAELEALVRSWSPDEVDWHRRKLAATSGQPPLAVLRVSWD